MSTPFVKHSPFPVYRIHNQKSGSNQRRFHTDRKIVRNSNAKVIGLQACLPLSLPILTNLSDFFSKLRLHCEYFVSTVACQRAALRTIDVDNVLRIYDYDV
ncbi:hypothetical protein PMAYCL1PPCAC_22161, partial [Pristionchus mayeri]